MPGTTLSSATTFGELLKYLRRRARLTQKDLGIAAGYSEAHVARLENGQRLPDLTTVKALFIPALGLEREPALSARLLELAEASHGKSTLQMPAEAPEHPTNIPNQLTVFIGRQQELAEVKQLLATTRLLTITGSAGVGKSRLAIQVATHVVGEYADGAWLVELASLTDPQLVPEAVASALGMSVTGGAATDMTASTMIKSLSDRQLLLVLDNCEHLINACAELAEALLKACRGLRIVATSREALNIPGETVWRIPSMAIDEAILVFADRARAAKPGFSLSEQNRPAIAQICERLDGIPLAIELAASRLRVLPAEQIAARLDDRFTLLTGGARTAQPRHQTLRTLIDWSYDLLGAQERLLLRRLSIFAGGWTLDAAESVCADPGPAEKPDGYSCSLTAQQVLPLLFDLAAKSLVLVDERVEETRYRLLETVREYGLDRLREQGELDAVRCRHAKTYVNMAEEAASHFRAKGHRLWLDRLTREQDNVRAALMWSREPVADSQLSLRLLGAMWHYWMWCGHLEEGRRWCADLLREISPDTPPRVRATALLGACALGFSEAGPYVSGGAMAQMHERLEEALALSQDLHDERGISHALCLLGSLAWDRNEITLAQSLVEESLSIARKTGLSSVAGWPLALLASLALLRAEFTRAIALYEEYLAMGRKTDDDWGVAEALNGLGLVALRQLDFRRALEMSQQGLHMARQVGYRRLIVQALMQVGESARYLKDFRRAKTLIEELHADSLAQDDEFGAGFALQLLAKIVRDEGDYPRARDLFVESMRHRLTLGPWSDPFNLEGLASVAAGQGEYVRAAHLLGAAEIMRENLHWPLPADNLPEYQHMVDTLRAHLEPTVFAAAWAEGCAMTVEQTLDYAIAG